MELKTASILDSGISGPGLSPGWSHCVKHFALIVNASLHPDVQMDTSELNAGSLPCNGLPSHPGGSSNTTSYLMHSA